MVEVDDRIVFPLLKPVIAWNEDVMFVGFAVAIPPLVILGAGKVHPAHQVQWADLGACREPLDEVDDIVTSVVGNPASAQLSPSSFFVRTSSSTTSASTSVLFLSLASSAAILSSSLDKDRERGRRLSKAAAPFSKKAFGHSLKQRPMELVLVAQIQNRHVLNKVFAQNGHFRLRGKLSAGRFHGDP